MFNPQPTIQTIPIMAGAHAYVIDNALQDPHYWVQFAQRYRQHFSQPSTSAYPGIEMPVTQEMAAQISDFFMLHLRDLLHARRTVRVASRFSMVTLQPEQLGPAQWLCHRDHQNVPPDQTIGASVLYLFDAVHFGGTSFYQPQQDDMATRQLIHDSSTLSAQEFALKHGVSAGFIGEGNAYFKRVSTVPARFNRMVFYDGSLFHSGQVPNPQLHTDQPSTGRLTLNSFFTCTRRA